MRTQRTSVPGVSARPKERMRDRFLVSFFITLFTKKPLGAIGFVLVLALFFVGIFSDLDWLGMPGVGLAPEGHNDCHVEHRMEPPSPRFPLGTDSLGRDVLSRIIHGARLSMIVGIAATSIHTIISTSLGIASGYIGGKFDLFLQRFIDAYMCFPDLVILIGLMAIVRPGLVPILLVLGVNAGLQGVRGPRALTFMIKENQYVHASSAIGARPMTIMWRHLLPNLMPLIIVTFSMRMGGVILAEAGLSFLGLGLPPPYPSWGAMISGPGRQFLLMAPWMMLWPGAALALAIFGINMFGDALRDLLDPRLRGGIGGVGGGYNLRRAEKAREKALTKLERDTGTRFS